MKKTIAILLAVCICLGFGFGFSLTAATTYAETAEYTSSGLTLVGEGAILIDAATGEILYGKNINQQYEPASTTKIITAILAMENLDLSDRLNIDEEIAFTGGSRIYLLEGEQVTGDEVMYGMMLESANDAAVAFAKAVAGSVSDFAVLMNKKAVELGAKNTNFVNPNGLHAEGHLSTAYDMAMIAKYCMQNETFREYCSTYKHVMPATNMQETRYFYSTNRLLYDNRTKVIINGERRGCKYDGVTGIKTGYTPEAGGCLVAGAERDGTELIAVVMKSTDLGRFQDCITLLDYGFANFRTERVLESGAGAGTVKVRGGTVNKVKVELAGDLALTVPADASSSLLETKIVLENRLKAPFAAGTKAGTAYIYEAGEVVGQCDVVTSGAVEKGGLLSNIGIPDKTAKIIGWVLLGLFLTLVLGLTVYVLIQRHRIKKKREQRRRERLQRQQEEAERRAQWETEYWQDVTAKATAQERPALRVDGGHWSNRTRSRREKPEQE